MSTLEVIITSPFLLDSFAPRLTISLAETFLDLQSKAFPTYPIIFPSLSPISGASSPLSFSGLISYLSNPYLDVYFSTDLTFPSKIELGTVVDCFVPKYLLLFSSCKRITYPCLMSCDVLCPVKYEWK